MLSSSLRRAVRTTASPSSSSAIVAFPKLLVPATTISNNAAGFASSQRRGAVRQQHQRRYSSSSKPPVPPNDGSRPIESQQTPANPSSAERKAKDNQGRKTAAGGAIGVGAVKSRQGSSTALLNLPSVPSTQHTPLEDINLASFFSVHRPISVSTSIPPTTNDAAFNAIFENKRRGNRSVDVINTLTSAVASMETAMHGGGRNQDQQLRNAVTQASASNAEPARIIHLDDVVVSEEDLHSSIAEFASRLTPFQPPAPPVPQEEEVVVNNLENADAAIDENANIRTYSTLLTIRETAYADGQRTFETSLAPLVPTNPEDNAAIIDEPALPIGAGKTYIERTVNRTMYTISVRRQRKLKMKKHKFKKLLRRTRTLRRKLDKA